MIKMIRYVIVRIGFMICVATIIVASSFVFSIQTHASSVTCTWVDLEYSVGACPYWLGIKFCQRCGEDGEWHRDASCWTCCVEGNDMCTIPWLPD